MNCEEWDFVAESGFAGLVLGDADVDGVAGEELWHAVVCGEALFDV